MNTSIITDKHNKLRTLVDTSATMNTGNTLYHHIVDPNALVSLMSILSAVLKPSMMTYNHLSLWTWRRCIKLLIRVVWQKSIYMRPHIQLIKPHPLFSFYCRKWRCVAPYSWFSLLFGNSHRCWLGQRLNCLFKIWLDVYVTGPSPRQGVVRWY